MTGGVPVRPITLAPVEPHEQSQRIIRRGEAMLAHPRSVIGYALAHRPVGAIAAAGGLLYEKCRIEDVKGAADVG